MTVKFHIPNVDKKNAHIARLFFPTSTKKHSRAQEYTVLTSSVKIDKKTSDAQVFFRFFDRRGRNTVEGIPHAFFWKRANLSKC